MEKEYPPIYTPVMQRNNKPLIVRKPASKRGGKQLTYIDHVRSYHKKHPRISWKQAMIDARDSWEQVKARNPKAIKPSKIPRKVVADIPRRDIVKPGRRAPPVAEKVKPMRETKKSRIILNAPKGLKKKKKKDVAKILTELLTSEKFEPKQAEAEAKLRKLSPEDRRFILMQTTKPHLDAAIAHLLGLEGERFIKKIQRRTEEDKARKLRAARIRLGLPALDILQAEHDEKDRRARARIAEIEAQAELEVRPETRDERERITAQLAAITRRRNAFKARRDELLAAASEERRLREAMEQARAEAEEAREEAEEEREILRKASDIYGQAIYDTSERGTRIWRELSKAVKENKEDFIGLNRKEQLDHFAELKAFIENEVDAQLEFERNLAEFGEYEGPPEEFEEEEEEREERAKEAAERIAKYEAEVVAEAAEDIARARDKGKEPAKEGEEKEKEGAGYFFPRYSRYGGAGPMNLMRLLDFDTKSKPEVRAMLSRAKLSQDIAKHIYGDILRHAKL